jgi:hypothetical protein
MSSTLGIRAHIVTYQYDKVVQLTRVLRIRRQNIFESRYQAHDIFVHEELLCRVPGSIVLIWQEYIIKHIVFLIDIF